MRKLEINDFINKKYGKLTVLSFEIKNKKTFCKSKCDCGTIKDFVFQSVKSGLTNSCGCIRQKRNNGSKYHYNEGFFEKITENSAYILGLIYTDGCLSKSSNRFTISLHKRDKEVLEKIGILIRNSSDIKYFERKSKKDSIISGYYLSCSNKKIYNSLIRHGLYPNKTSTIKPAEYLINNRHFWRGCIDGDGGVSLQREKYLRIDFGGSESMIDAFIKFCNTHISYNSKYRYIKNDYHRIYITGKNAKIIYNILYQNEDYLFMERKNKFIAIN
jgi:hypothetical protein